MNPAMIILIALYLIALWIGLSGQYKKIGNLLKSIGDSVTQEVKEESEEENE